MGLVSKRVGFLVKKSAIIKQTRTKKLRMEYNKLLFHRNIIILSGISTNTDFPKEKDVGCGLSNMPSWCNIK